MKSFEQEQTGPILALPGPQFDHIEIARHGLRIGNFTIKAHPNDLENDTKPDSTEHAALTAFSIWDSSIVLARFIELQARQSVFSFPRHIIELGCGTGIAGIAACAAFYPEAALVLTDLPTTLASVNSTVDKLDERLQDRIRVHSLDWIEISNMDCFQLTESLLSSSSIRMSFFCTAPGDVLEQKAYINEEVSLSAGVEESGTESGKALKRGMRLHERSHYSVNQDKYCKFPFDMVIVSDCVWLESLVGPLVTTIEKLLDLYKEFERSKVLLESFKVLIAHQSRSASVDELFFELLKRRFSVVPIERLDGEPDRGRVELFWAIPKRSIAED